MENRNWWNRPELNRRGLSATLPVCCPILPVFPGGSAFILYSLLVQTKRLCTLNAVAT